MSQLPLWAQGIPDYEASVNAVFTLEGQITALKNKELNGDNLSVNLDYFPIGYAACGALDAMIDILYQDAIMFKPDAKKKDYANSTMGQIMGHLLQEKLISPRNHRTIQTAVRGRNNMIHWLPSGWAKKTITEEEAIEFLRRFIFQLYPPAIRTIEKMLR